MVRKRVTGKSVKNRQKLEKHCDECGVIGDQGDHRLPDLYVKLYPHPEKKGKKICSYCLRELKREY